MTPTQKRNLGTAAVIAFPILGVPFLEWYWFHEALNAGYARRAAEAKK